MIVSAAVDGVQASWPSIGTGRYIERNAPRAEREVKRATLERERMVGGGQYPVLALSMRQERGTDKNES